MLHIDTDFHDMYDFDSDRHMWLENMNTLGKSYLRCEYVTNKERMTFVVEFEVLAVLLIKHCVSKFDVFIKEIRGLLLTTPLYLTNGAMYRGYINFVNE